MRVAAVLDVSWPPPMPGSPASLNEVLSVPRVTAVGGRRAVDLELLPQA